eukprot:g13960.t1
MGSRSVPMRGPWERSVSPMPPVFARGRGLTLVAAARGSFSPLPPHGDSSTLATDREHEYQSPERRSASPLNVRRTASPFQFYADDPTRVRDPGSELELPAKSSKLSRESAGAKNTYSFVEHVPDPDAASRFRTSYSHHHSWETSKDNASDPAPVVPQLPQRPASLKAQREARRAVSPQKVGSELRERAEAPEAGVSSSATAVERRFPGDTLPAAGIARREEGADHLLHPRGAGGSLNPDPDSAALMSEGGSKKSRQSYLVEKPENADVDARLHDRKHGQHHPGDLADFRKRARARHDHVSPDHPLTSMSPARHHDEALSRQSSRTLLEQGTRSRDSSKGYHPPQMGSTDDHLAMHHEETLAPVTEMRRATHHRTWAEHVGDVHARAASCHAHKHRNYAPHRCALTRDRGNLGKGIHSYTEDARASDHHWDHHPHHFDRRARTRACSAFNLRQVETNRQLDEARRYGTVNVKPYGLFAGVNEWKSERWSPRGPGVHATQFAAFGGHERSEEGSVRARFDVRIPGREDELGMTPLQWRRRFKYAVALKVTDPQEAMERLGASGHFLQSRFANKHNRSSTVVAKRKGDLAAKTLEDGHSHGQRSASSRDLQEAHRSVPPLRLKPTSDLVDYAGGRRVMRRQPHAAVGGDDHVGTIWTYANEPGRSSSPYASSSARSRSEQPRSVEQGTPSSGPVVRVLKSSADLRNFPAGAAGVHPIDLAPQVRRELPQKGTEHTPSRASTPDNEFRQRTGIANTCSTPADADTVRSEGAAQSEYAELGNRNADSADMLPDYSELIGSHAGQTTDKLTNPAGQRKQVDVRKSVHLEHDDGANVPRHAGAASTQLRDGFLRPTENRPEHALSPYRVSVDPQFARNPAFLPTRRTRGDSLQREEIALASAAQEKRSTSASPARDPVPLSSGAVGACYNMKRDISPLLQRRNRWLVGRSHLSTPESRYVAAHSGERSLTGANAHLAGSPSRHWRELQQNRAVELELPDAASRRAFRAAAGKARVIVEDALDNDVRLYNPNEQKDPTLAGKGEQVEPDDDAGTLKPHRRFIGKEKDAVMKKLREVRFSAEAELKEYQRENCAVANKHAAGTEAAWKGERKNINMVRQLQAEGIGPR